MENIRIGGIGTGSICVDGKADISCDAFTAGIYIKTRHPDGDFVDKLSDFSALQKSFPGAKGSYSFKYCRAELSVLNPFIPFNDADSCIPGAMFEIMLENISQTEAEYSLSLLALLSSEHQKRLEIGKNSSYKHIVLENTKSYAISFADDNFSYMLNADRTMFYDSLINDRFLKGESESPEGVAFALYTCLGAGEKKVFRFVISWYDDNSDFALYYTRYFTSCTECSHYCFAEWDRLNESTLKFRNNILSSSYSDSVKNDIFSSLSLYSEDIYLRNYDGLIYINEDSGYSVCHDGMYEFTSLFPNIVKALVSYEYSECMDSRGAVLFDGKENMELQLTSFMRFYSYVLASADFEFLAKYWMYARKSLAFFTAKKNMSGWDADADGILDRMTDERSEYLNALYRASLKGASYFAMTLRDRKYKRLFSLLYENAFSLNPEGEETLPFLEIPLHKAIGFEFDMLMCSISVAPSMEYSDGQTSFGYAYLSGMEIYVERGPGYIQIAPRNSEMAVRYVKIPQKPLRVYYGDRVREFEYDGEYTDLHNQLPFSKKKDITIII